MDYAQIAAAVTAFIAPFMPFLIEAGKAGGQKFAETVAEHGGEAAWKKAQSIWQTLTTRTENDGDIEDAADYLAGKPEQERRQEALAEALAERMVDDPELATLLSEKMGGTDTIQDFVVKNSTVGKVIQKIKAKGKHQQTFDVQDSQIDDVEQSVE